MAPATPALLQRAETRLKRDRNFAAVLAAVVDAPAGSAGTYRRTAASALNQQRLHDALTSFREGALRTGEVQAVLNLRTPQAVHRLRSRGRLVGAQLGNSTWFPAWQLSGGRLRSDLPELLARLTRFSSDAVAVDRVMRLERAELGGRSIVEALDKPKTAPVAWVLLDQLGS
jgi:hypothetical protein